MPYITTSGRLSFKYFCLTIFAWYLFSGTIPSSLSQISLPKEAWCATSSAMANPTQATFAAGCFWGVELAFQRVPGVIKTTVGYTQGHVANPTYNAVCSGKTGHAEAVLVEYNPDDVSYSQLLDLFWKRHNPTQLNRQGNDVGSQYRSGIYYHSPEQEKIARESLQTHQTKLGQKIATEILPATVFYPAEEYHQQYLEKGGRFKKGQSAAKGCSDPIRCYG